MNTIKEEHQGNMAPTAMDPMQPDMTLTPSSSTSPSEEHLKGSESPSPSASGKTPSSASRRPPRKSTLTQQQKNQKRQRATQDQLTTLEMEFSKNPTPTATVRERIADEINMTERSVQIWFQNRYVNQHLAWPRSRLPSLTNTYFHLDVPRSSCWPRRASKPVKTLTRSPNL